MAGLALACLVLVACSAPDGATSCGWDTTTQAGKDAMTERLDAVATWQLDHPGEPPPPIDSPWWHGECASTSTPVPPPEHEDEGQG